jgi:hypothetical protein
MTNIIGIDRAGHYLGASLPHLASGNLLGQIGVDTAITPLMDTLSGSIGQNLLNLVFGIAALLVGYIVATIAASIAQKLLHRTSLDNKIATWITGSPQSNLPVEKWIGGTVFWVIMLFAIVAFLQTIQLTAVSEPIRNLLSQVTTFLPKLLGAGLLLLAAWLLATIAKMVIIRGLGSLGLERRLGEQTGETQQFAVTETVANALYWFIFLLFLPAVLSTLELEGTLQPVQQLLNQILSILPNIFAAILIGGAGWLIAQVVRRIVTNLVAATGADQLGRKFGLNQSQQSLSVIAGTLVYVLILIPTAIAALNALRIEAISQPAISMLTQILNAIPQIFTAVAILGIAYVIGQFVSEILTNILTGIGFNNVFQWLGMGSIMNHPPAAGQSIEEPTTSRTPSEFLGVVAWVGIMLFGAIAATNVLQIPALTQIISALTVVAGQVIYGLIVFAIGLYLANLAFSIISSSGNRQAKIVGQAARISIIALVTAMALQQMGIASDIVNLAFGLLLGAIAVAIALAFGLGGRDIAAEQVRSWLASFQDSDKIVDKVDPTTTTTTRTTTTDDY